MRKIGSFLSLNFNKTLFKILIHFVAFNSVDYKFIKRFSLLVFCTDFWELCFSIKYSFLFIFHCTLILVHLFALVLCLCFLFLFSWFYSYTPAHLFLFFLPCPYYLVFITLFFVRGFLFLFIRYLWENCSSLGETSLSNSKWLNRSRKNWQPKMKKKKHESF